MVKIPATKPGLAAIEDVIAAGPLDQRDADLLAAPLRRGRGVLRARHRAPRRRRRRPAARWPRSRASSSRGSTPRPTGAWRSSERTPARVGRAPSRSIEMSHDELQGRLAVANAKLAYRALWGGLPRPPLGVPGRQGRDAPAGAVGVDVDQEPGVPRHDLCRRADRPGHRQHDARGDDRGLPGPRPPRARAGAGAGRRAQAARRAGARGRRLRRRHRRRSSARGSRSSRRPSRS